MDEIVNGKKERRWMRRHKGESITIAIIVVTAFLAIIEGSCCVSVSADRMYFAWKVEAKYDEENSY